MAKDVSGRASNSRFSSDARQEKSLNFSANCLSLPASAPDLYAVELFLFIFSDRDTVKNQQKTAGTRLKFIVLHCHL